MQSAATPKERVQRLLWAQFRFFGKQPANLTLFHQVRGLLKLQPDTARSLQRECDRYVRFLTEELGAALDHWQYSPATLQWMACAMAGFVTGYLSYLVITGVRKDGVRDLEIPSQIFLEGIVGSGWPG